ncbi:MAG: tetratricopeptide repeat protein [Myxococcota bacterium]
MSDPIDEASEKMTGGDVHGAYATLRQVLDYPGGLDDRATAVRAFTVFSEIAGALGGAEFGNLVRRAATSPDDADVLNDIGYALYEQDQYGVAATLLSRANQLRPGEAKIVLELATCLEAFGANGEAVAVLRASGLADRDPVAAYLLAFNALMVGDRAEPPLRIPVIRKARDETALYMADALEAMLARASAIAQKLPLDGHALSAWHSILNGGVLLHESPHGYDEPMRGRYAYVSDSVGLMKEGIQRLGRVLDKSGRRPTRVVSGPDRASRVLAEASAKRFDLPLLAWSGAALEHSLVVVWDLDHVGDKKVLQALQEHQPGQVLWVHASNWVSPFPYTPDVTTLLYQTITHPFMGGALQVDPVTRETKPAEPDLRSEAELSREILSATITDPSETEISTLEEILDANRSLPPTSTLGVFRDEGPRLRQRMGSPVRSARFL